MNSINVILRILKGHWDYDNSYLIRGRYKRIGFVYYKNLKK